MATNKKNMRKISEDLKSFITKKMENNGKKIIEKLIEKMNNTIDEINNRTKAIDRKAEAAESLVKQHQNNISNLAN